MVQQLIYHLYLLFYVLYLLHAIIERVVFMVQIDVYMGLWVLPLHPLFDFLACEASMGCRSSSGYLKRVFGEKGSLSCLLIAQALPGLLHFAP